MRVLLVPPKENYPDPDPVVSLVSQGFAYLAAALRQAGHEVFGRNLNYVRREGSARETLQEELRRTAAECQPELVGFGGLSANYLFVRDAIELWRNIAPDVPIVCGGGLVSADREFVFERFRPDFAIVGEAEETLLELVALLKRGGDPAEISGLLYCNDGEMTFTGEPSCIADLDSLPFPDYEPFAIDTYLNLCNQRDNHFHARTQTNPRIFPVSASRSCPFHCTFCYHPVGRYRKRSPEKVLEEIAYFHEKYHFNVLKLYDEMLGSHKEDVRTIAEGIRNLNLDFDWTCSMRVPDANLETLKLLKATRCIHVGYGFESAADEVLESMRKRTRVSEIQRAIGLTEQAGVGVQGNFIYGDVAETERSIRKTHGFFLTHCRDHIVHNDFIIPYPGSSLFEHCLRTGVITDKDHYYETIHTRPAYNMTSLTDEKYHELLDAIIGNWYQGYESAELLSFRKVEYVSAHEREILGLRRRLYDVRIRCPHCGRAVPYRFPIADDTSTAAGLLEAIQPIVCFCPRCHKRSVLAMLAAFGLQEAYHRYLAEVDQLAEQATPVAIVPVIGHVQTMVHRYYGLRPGTLNVECVLTVGSFNPEDRPPYPTVECNKKNLRRLRKMGADLLVLPHPDYQVIVGLLRDYGIDQQHVHRLDLAGAIVPKPRPKKKPTTQ